MCTGFLMRTGFPMQKGFKIKFMDEKIARISSEQNPLTTVLEGVASYSPKIGLSHNR